MGQMSGKEFSWSSTRDGNEWEEHNFCFGVNEDKAGPKTLEIESVYYFSLFHRSGGVWMMVRGLEGK